MRSSTAQGDGTLAQVAQHSSDPTQVKKSGDDPVQQSTKGTQHEPDPETQESVDTLGEIANLNEAQMGWCKRERSVQVNGSPAASATQSVSPADTQPSPTAG